MALVQFTNRLSSRSPRIMKLAKAFVLQCLNLNIHFSGRHVSGIDNGIANALSRFQMDKFWDLASGPTRNQNGCG